MAAAKWQTLASWSTHTADHAAAAKLLSRKRQGRANRRKAHIRLASQPERVANARADFQHKLSRTIINENHAVIVETLKSANMMKNIRLARYIGDALGVHLVKLDQWFAHSHAIAAGTNTGNAANGS